MNTVESPLLSRGRHFCREVFKHRWFYLLLLPAMAFFIIFRYIPMYGITLAFKDFRVVDGIMASPWASPIFKYFERAFSSDLFRRSLTNTLVISFLKIIVAFPIPIILALLIDELPGTKFKKTVQTVSYMPYFMSWVVLGGIMRALLSPSYGAVNYVIQALGGSPIHFLGEASMFRSVVFFSHIWQSAGYGTIVYLAAIAGIDQEQYEAARIDGANRFQTIMRITIPSIAPTILTMLILNVGSIMSAGFDQIFNLYSPVTYATGDIIDTYTYRVGMVNMEYSYSTAVSLFQNLIGLTLALVTNFAAKKLDPDAGLL